MRCVHCVMCVYGEWCVFQLSVCTVQCVFLCDMWCVSVCIVCTEEYVCVVRGVCLCEVCALWSVFLW